MILLDTDIMTLWLLGHPSQQACAGDLGCRRHHGRKPHRTAARRFDYLLKAIDGAQLQRPNRGSIRPSVSYGLVIVPIDAAAAAEFDRLRQIKTLEEDWPGRLADRQHRPRPPSHARHS